MTRYTQSDQTCITQKQSNGIPPITTPGLSRAFLKWEQRRRKLSMDLAETAKQHSRQPLSERVESILEKFDDVAYVLAALTPRTLADVQFKGQVLLEYLDDQDDLPGLLARALCHDLMTMQLGAPKANVDTSAT